MASAQDHWPKHMLSPLHIMTECVAAVAATSLPSACILAQVPRMRMLRQLLSVISDSASSSMAEKPRFCMHPEFDPFIRDFTSLLTALIPQLDKLGSRLSIAATSIGTAEEEVFWELWKFLLVGSSAFALATSGYVELLPIDIQPFYPPLCAAFNSLLQCLLTVSRFPAWVAMKKQHGIDNINSELRVILAQPLQCLHRITFTTSMPVLLSHLSCFPPSALTLLCCIISEQFTNLPQIIPPMRQAASMPATSYTQGRGRSYLSFPLCGFLDMQTVVISNLAALYRSSGLSDKYSFVTTPAVLHFLKTVLILPQKTVAVQPGLVLRCLECLDFLFNLYINITHGVLCSTSDANSVKDIAGVPRHVNPRLCMQVLDTDARLLHALNVHHEENFSLQALCYANQAIVINNWMISGMLTEVPAEVLLVMARSVGGLAKICASQGLCLMEELGKERLDMQQTPLQPVLRRGGSGEQEHTLTYIFVTASRQPVSVAKDSRVIKELRVLMLLVSNFQVQLQDCNPDTRSGEWSRGDECSSLHSTPHFEWTCGVG